MKIQEVETLTGLDRATIRYYEKEQLLVPERSDNGYRNYSEENVKLLQKIKLLRKLGIPLSEIKNLEQGSECLSDVLSNQILILDQQIRSDSAARSVCQELLDNRAQYRALDSSFYLQKLASQEEHAAFTEEMKSEQHPVRRYLARIIDFSLLIAIIRIFLVVVIRIRPFNDTVLDTVTPVIGYILSMPVSAFLLHLWGTTPGKWLMGIYLEDPNGGRLSFYNAISREVNVLIAGFGFHIPIFRQIRLYISYRDAVNGKGTEWDEDAELRYTDLNISKILLTVITYGLIFVLNYISICDAELPRYRSNNITAEQFTANYQDYEKQFENDNTMILQEDGSWEKRTDYSVEITQIGDPDHIRQNFQYNFNENGGIHTIAFADSWDDMHHNIVLPDYCYTVLYTAVASQKSTTVKDLQKLNQFIQDEFFLKLENGGRLEGEFTVSNVTFCWKAELPEKEYVFIDLLGGTLMDFDDANQPIAYKLEFVITIE